IPGSIAFRIPYAVQVGYGAIQRDQVNERECRHVVRDDLESLGIYGSPLGKVGRLGCFFEELVNRWIRISGRIAVGSANRAAQPEPGHADRRISVTSICMHIYVKPSLLEDARQHG